MDKQIDALEEAVRELEEVAPDLTIADGAILSDLQLRLGTLVLQIVQTEKTRRDLDTPLTDD